MGGRIRGKRLIVTVVFITGYKREDLAPDLRSVRNNGDAINIFRQRYNCITNDTGHNKVNYLYFGAVDSIIACGCSMRAWSTLIGSLRIWRESS